MKRLVILVMLLIACGGDAPRPASWLSNQKAVRSVLRATVALVEKSSDEERAEGAGEWDGEPFCTAFYIGRTTLLTAAHCVRQVGPDRRTHFAVWGQIDDNHELRWGPYSAYVVHADAATDTAVLTTARTSKWTIPLALDAGDPGAQVFSVGHPVGLPWTLTAGILSSQSFPTRPRARHIVQASSSVYYGNSGGPLLNRTGQLVGICRAIRSVPHLGIFVGLMDIRAALRAAALD